MRRDATGSMDTKLSRSTGITVTDNIVYQDNQSAMLLEKNGKRSSGKRTRHINIRCFFITDRIAARELSMEYCPTGEMLGDFFTKPLQGTRFRKFRDRILNLTDDDLRKYTRMNESDAHLDSEQGHPRSVWETNESAT